jgi:hypothetical protein
MLPYNSNGLDTCDVVLKLWLDLPMIINGNKGYIPARENFVDGGDIIPTFSRFDDGTLNPTRAVWD